MRKYKPTTPSRRQMTTVSYRKVLTTDKPYKPLTTGFKRAVGRGSSGRITTRHKGGGHKRLYRDIDFKYDKKDVQAKVETIEYDPNRTAFIALVLYRDGERRYVLVPADMHVGDTFIVSEIGDVKTGNRMLLKNIPVGTLVYNVELKPSGGAKAARGAGSYAEVLSNDAGYTTLKMPSSEIRKVPEKCFASIGTVSNEEYRLTTLGKAGRSRWLGIRPTVRGSAMNPVDHPYGGGEGRAGRGRRRAVSKWGKPTGGVRTRRVKKYSRKLIIQRRKIKKKK